MPPPRLPGGEEAGPQFAPAEDSERDDERHEIGAGGTAAIPPAGPDAFAEYFSRADRFRAERCRNGLQSRSHNGMTFGAVPSRS